MKKRGRKKAEPSVKSLGLFDHIKHIRLVQDPDYFNNLTELDKKSFNHFMILKGLSMNPDLLEYIGDLFRYFDKIPSPQFYTLLIGLIPIDNPKRFYPWVKAKKSPFSKDLIYFISQFFEVSKKEAEEYAFLLSSTKNGKEELIEICRDFGLTEKEVDEAMEGNEDE